MSKGPTVTQRLANIKHMPTLVAATMAVEKPVEAYLIKDIISILSFLLVCLVFAFE
jgi:hypothetical protein